MRTLANHIERGDRIASLQKRAWATAEEHGFHEPTPTFGELIALVHSELSEALEEYRNLGDEAFRARTEYAEETDTGKPEGVAAELADAVIRILDTAAIYGIDLERAIDLKMAYNDTRPFRHGGKAL